MFLETGWVGGFLIVLAFRRMWLDAGSRGAERAGLTTGLRAALVAAAAGGMGGEYFYGGIGLLSLFVAYAPTGGLPRDGTLRHLPHSPPFSRRITQHAGSI